MHPIMLCQPDNRKSCSACCGLYNWKDHSRAAITEIVTLQTGLFFELPDFNDFTAFRTERNRRLRNTPLFETIYSCEFVGFIDPERRRAGCLLHPMVTGREDLRDNCFYGSTICNEHFCPGFGCFTIAEQQAVVDATDDWYLYGLVITDIDLVKEIFRHAENTLGESLKPERLRRARARDALRALLRLKEDWPFKAPENRLGKYYFSESEYHIARIDYERQWGIPASRFDKILVSLESDFKTRQDLQAAETLLASKIDRLISACTA
jgi:hypothetical protein